MFGGWVVFLFLFFFSFHVLQKERKKCDCPKAVSKALVTATIMCSRSTQLIPRNIERKVLGENKFINKAVGKLTTASLQVFFGQNKKAGK